MRMPGLTAIVVLFLLSGCGYKRVTVDEFKSLAAIENNLERDSVSVVYVGMDANRHLFKVVYGMFAESRVAVLSSEVVIESELSGEEIQAIFSGDGGLRLHELFGSPGAYVRIRDQNELQRLENRDGRIVEYVIDNTKNITRRYYIPDPPRESVVVRKID